MLWLKKTPQTSPNPTTVIRGRTLPSLLDEACDRTPNAKAFNQYAATGWRPMSNQAFRFAAEVTALGLLNLGLEKGDRVALLMYSDINFCITDFGCLLANLVNVPIDLTQTIEHIIFTLRHSDAKVLVISNLDLLEQISPYFHDTSALQYVVVVGVSSNGQKNIDDAFEQTNDSDVQVDTTAIPETACLQFPMLLSPPQNYPHTGFPQCIQVFSLNDIQRKGRSHYFPTRLQQLRSNLSPSDLATLIYIPDATGQMQGVMLTHENLAGNALASFTSISDLERGDREVALTFLPLNHVLARALLYGHMNYGHSIYFSNPNRLMKHLQEVKPTLLITVPLLLNKMYSKILERGNQASWLSISQRIFNWALHVAKQYQLEHPPAGFYKLQLMLADRLVLSRWRSLFGGRLKYLISGGSALKAEIATVFGAAGITILQGYGLTQTSAVVCFNRGRFNRAGTVGIPIPNVEVAIADDHEILVRGPYNTLGYYNNPVATQELIDAQGWLHTGDLGEIQDGFLKITGLKKSLFKLLTGKYIAPQPIESRLMLSPLVERAIAVGAEQKFCAMLLVPNLEALQRYAYTHGIDLPDDALLEHPCITALYHSLVEAANCHLPYWATVKRFRLINQPFTIENGLLTTDGTINRAQILQVFAQEIEALFDEADGRRKKIKGLSADSAKPSICPTLPEASCPAFAQSLNPRLTTMASVAFFFYTAWQCPVC
jgi:long-chain acyl-CoA synthetase